MPTPYVQKLAKETGKPVAEVEKLWDKAKKIASEDFGKPESQFGSKEFSYVIGIVKQMVGKHEDILDPAKFLRSKFSAKEFVDRLVNHKSLEEDVVSSGVAMNSDNIQIGTTIPPDDTETDVPYKDKDKQSIDDLNIKEDDKVDSASLEYPEESKKTPQTEPSHRMKEEEIVSDDFEAILDREGLPS